MVQSAVAEDSVLPKIIEFLNDVLEAGKNMKHL
jgi:hypothetical protein